jgi:glycosyltransferase involved in cell wall biosynthesis
VSTRILLAGTFDPEFARNRVLLSLLKRAGFEIEVARRELWGHERHLLVDQPKWQLLRRGLTAYPGLIRTVARAQRPDVIFVPYPGYGDVPLIAPIARARRVPLMFDTFISLYDTIVEDRGLRGRKSVIGRATHAADTVACRLAELVLCDTPAHADYFAEATGVSRDRFRVLWLGAQEDVFRPQPDVTPVPGLVVFHGTFVPLQGLPTIIRAAKLLEPNGIRFRIIGDGQERPVVEKLVGELEAANVELPGRVPLQDVPREIAAASLCLGIFGTSAKAGRVVPNKVFECLAVGRPVVTGDTGAIRAAFSGSEVAVVPAGDPESLAEKIRTLLAHPARLTSLAEAGRERYERDYSEDALGKLLAGYVEELVGRRATATSDGPRPGTTR